jgi:hypothetical protein
MNRQNRTIALMFSWFGHSESSLSANHYLINVETDTWAFQWLDANETGKIYRQYEFDLTTEPSAQVTLKDNAANTVFSVASNAVTGAIATQVVSRGYYQRSTGNTLQDYGPFTLTITKAGKMPYTQTGIVLTEKTKLQIELRDQLTGTADIGDVVAGATFYKDDADTKLTGTLVGPAVFVDVASGMPVLNLAPKKLTNKNVLVLG